jgi:hypothetical protein
MKKQLISVIGMSLLLVLVNPPQAQANEEENPGFFNSIINSLNKKLTEITGELGLPDLQQIVNSIMDEKQSENKGTELSTRIENKPDGSYAIQADLAKQAIVKATNLQANNSTLGKEAQQTTSEQIRTVSERVNNNIEFSEQSQDLSNKAQTLATESQSLDVSQQILQNLSAQSALEAEQNANVASQISLIAENQETLIQLHQQAQVDRALANMIDAQQANSINEANTMQRREDASNSITSSIQSGMLIMPGGMTLDN